MCTASLTLQGRITRTGKQYADTYILSNLLEYEMFSLSLFQDYLIAQQKICLSDKNSLFTETISVGVCLPILHPLHKSRRNVLYIRKQFYIYAAVLALSGKL